MGATASSDASSSSPSAAATAGATAATAAAMAAAATGSGGLLPPYVGRNELVNRLVSDATWTPQDTATWQPLLAGQTQAAAAPRSLRQLASSLAESNARTQNFNSLLLISAELLGKVRTAHKQASAAAAPATTATMVLHACHALFLVRTFSAHFVQTMDSVQLAALFRGYRPTTAAGATASIKTDAASGWFTEYFLDELLLTLIELPANESFQLLYVEVLATVTTLCGTQLAQPTTERSAANTFLELIFSQYGAQAVPISGRLIHNVEASMDRTRIVNATSPVLAYPLPKAGSALVADLSSILLCILTNQEWRRSPNPFRQVFSRLRDSAAAPAANAASPPPLAISATPSSASKDVLTISFELTYQALVHNIDRRDTISFLYVAMVENRAFSQFVCSHDGPEQLLVPLLRLVYGEMVSSDRDTSFIYVLLICLLLLSQNAKYTQRIQSIVIASVEWYTDRELRHTPLPSLCTLVLLRAIQLNVAELKDVYLQTTCLASLANLAPHMTNIHQMAAQRLITFFDTVAKKYHKMTKARGSAFLTEPSSSLSIASASEMMPSATAPEDVTLMILADLLQLLLEIINVILVKQIEHNPRLVYVLLYQHDQVTSFRHHPTMGHLIENIDSTLAYFNAKIAQANLNSPSPDAIVAVVTSACSTFRTDGFDRLKDVSNLGFGYEEAATADEFFGPFAWTAVVRHPVFAAFSPVQITLFRRDKQPSSAPPTTASS